MVKDKDKNKRLNLVIPYSLYDRMIEKVEQSDIKNITDLIKIATNNLIQDDLKKDGLINYEDLPEILRILNVLYEVKSFKNHKVKLELRYLFNDIQKILKNTKILKGKTYSVNRLDICMKEIVMLDLSCSDIDILINNNIIKEGVYYVK